MEKITKKLINMFIQILPRPLKYEISRRRLTLPQSLPEGFQVKLAKSISEYTQAFQVLHDSYVAEEFMKPSSTGLRLTPYHFLKSTSTFIVVDGAQVIATLAMIRDSRFGLPMDEIYDLSAFRAKGERIGEVSALAVHPSYRGQKGLILFHLIRELWSHALDQHRLDHLVIAVNPKRADFYRSLLLFQDLPKGPIVDSYPFAEGAPAVGQWVNIRNSHLAFKEAYGARPSKGNMYAFLYDKRPVSSRPYYTLYNQPELSSRVLRNHFLKKVSRMWDKMFLYEKRKFADVYSLQNPDDVFKDPRELEVSDFRRTPRIEVECPVFEFGPLKAKEGTVLGWVQDVSAQGFRLAIANPLELEPQSKSTLEMALGPGKRTRLRAQLKWKKDQNLGFQILSADVVWAEMIHQIQTRESRRAA